MKNIPFGKPHFGKLSANRNINILNVYLFIRSLDLEAIKII